jgi:hypothetical protein
MVTVGIMITERGSMNEAYSIGIETDMPFEEVRDLLKATLAKIPLTSPPTKIPGVETQ